MKEQAKSLTILISCASDVVKEIDSVEKAVKRFNDLFSDFLNATIKTCRWLTDAYPTTLCDRPQGGVNDQLVHTSDMCIAIFRARFGEPRGGKDKNGDEYQSGTEEEIALMEEQRKQVFIYFLSEECIGLKDLDREQYEKVKAFKKECGRKYIYAIYNENDDIYKSESDLEYRFFNHLCQYFIKDQEFIKVNENDEMYFNLIGGLSRENQYDIEELKSLAQKNDDQVSLMLDQLANDAARKRERSAYIVGTEIISIPKREAFWRRIGCKYSDRSLFLRFQEVSKKVLSDPDNYSNAMVTGIIETLALLGNKAEVFTNLRAIHEIASIADNVVHSLFFGYDDKEKSKVAFERYYGASQGSEWLSILAEASPEHFLKAVERAMECPDFSHHVDLLQALERLAWDSRYVVHVCTILARFFSQPSSVNPDNENSPVRSIATIMMHVYIYSESEQREWDEKKLAALEWMQKEHPEVLAKVFTTVLFNGRFAYAVRKKDGRELPVTFPCFMALDLQYAYPRYTNRKQILAYWGMALAFSQENFTLLKNFLTNMKSCSEEIIDDIIKSFDSEMVKNLEENEKYELWSILKTFAQENRHFHKAEWAKGDACLAKIDRAESALAPINNVARLSWYFVNELIGGTAYEENGHDEEENERLQIRKEKVESLIASDGAESVLLLYEMLREQKGRGNYALAIALSALKRLDIDSVLLPALLGLEKDESFIRHYVGRRFPMKADAVGYIAKHASRWNKAQLGEFLSAVPEVFADNELSEMLDSAELIASYWQKVDHRSADEAYLRKLLEHGRYEILFHVFRMSRNVGISRAFIIEALECMLSLDTLPVEWWAVNWQIAQIINDDSIADGVKENLEWLNLKFYQPYGECPTPAHLFRKLSSDSKYLCDIIKTATEESQQFVRGQSGCLLWLWHPAFEEMQNIPLWYSEIAKALDEKSLKHFQKFLGRRLMRRNKDESGENVVWMDQSMEKVVNDSPEMISAYSLAARGIGDLDDVLLSAHDQEFDERQKNEVSFWKEKAEEIDKRGFVNFAAELRLMAEEMSRPRFWEIA